MAFFNKKSFDFIAIGDTVTDAFIRLSQAEVQDSIDHKSRELCVTFGDKVPYDFVEVLKGVGNSANAAVSAARLGLSTALIADVGNDQNGSDIIDQFKKEGIATNFVSVHKGMKTNYHYVLWYGVERTILVKHEEYPYAFPKMSTAPAWIYLSSLGEKSLDYHLQIADYLEANPTVKLAFQPGTYQMKFGVKALEKIYKRTEIFYCNKEEAQRILATDEKDIKKLLSAVRALGPNIAVITDGIEGAYATDGTSYWFMPIYPQEPFERTGAGDAFASTVTVALALGKPLTEALTWGPINSASVVQQVGAQKGLLTRAQLGEKIAKAPADYKLKVI